MANYVGNAFEGFMDQIHRSQNAVGGDLTMDRFFLRLQRMLERKARIHWNKWYFSKYIDDKIAPWSLRIHIFPTINKLEPEFKNKWEENLHLCSMKMMELLCGHFSHELVSLDKEIEKLYQDNDSIISNDQFSSRESLLKTNLETYVSEILKTKEKKFMRDKLSYANAQAYNWAPTKNKRRNIQMHAFKKAQSEPNDSDTSSASSLSSQAPDRTVNQKKSEFNKRTDGNPNAPPGVSKRFPSTSRAPINTRATTANANAVTSARNYHKTLTNTNLVNSPLT